MATRGRPKREGVDTLRAKAWVAECMRLTGSKSIYAVRQLAMGTQAADVRYFERIAKGTYSPGSVLQRNVEKVIPGSRGVYLIGPMEEGRNVPLWQALAGPMEEMWDVLNWYSVAYQRSRLFGYLQQQRVDFLVQRLTNGKLTSADLKHGRPMKDLLDQGMGVLDVPDGPLSTKYYEMLEHWVEIYRPPVEEDTDDMVDWNMQHPVVKLMLENALTPTLGGLAATVALWRLSHFLGEYWREMDDLLRGLMLASRRKLQLDGSGAVIGSIPDNSAGSYASVVLGPLQIEEDFMRLIRKMWEGSARDYAAVVHTLDAQRGRMQLPVAPSSELGS